MAPGTGKTTTVIKILAMLLQQTPALNIAILAPTGKAALRLSAAVNSGKNQLSLPEIVLQGIPRKAQTIHRFLRFGKNGPRYHQHKHIAVDCIVIDEASMVDLTLMTQLLQAIPANCRLILLGDRDQLSSVEAGSVLTDLTGRGHEIQYSQQQADRLADLNPDITVTIGDKVPAIADAIALLGHSFRFAAGSGIAELAQFVNRGEGKQALDLLQAGQGGQLQWLENSAFKTCLDEISTRYIAVSQQAEVETAFNMAQDFLVLALTHAGEFGIDAINHIIRQNLQQQLDIGQDVLFRGLPIMIERNDYESGLFNGDMALLWPNESGEIRAWFQQQEGAMRNIAVQALPQFKIAFAITVHKSQGSESDEVILLLPPQNSPLLSRELLYTAITRARKRLQIVSSAQSFLLACEQRVQRSAGLAEHLGW